MVKILVGAVHAVIAGSIIGLLIGFVYSRLGSACFFFCKPVNGAISGAFVALVYYILVAVAKR